MTDGKNPRAALQRLIKNDRDYGYALDTDRKFQGIVSADSLRDLIDQPEDSHRLKNAFVSDVVPAHTGDSMQDILPEVARNPWALPIVDDEGKYLGAVSKNLFLKTLQRNDAEATAAVASLSENP